MFVRSLRSSFNREMSSRAALHPLATGRIHTQRYFYTTNTQTGTFSSHKRFYSWVNKSFLYDVILGFLPFLIFCRALGLCAQGAVEVSIAMDQRVQNAIRDEISMLSDDVNTENLVSEASDGKFLLSTYRLSKIKKVAQKENRQWYECEERSKKVEDIRGKVCAIMIYSENDHNGAFMRVPRHWNHILSDAGYTTVYKRVETVDQIVDLMAQVKKHNQIQVLLIGGHGTSGSILFGKKKNENRTPDRNSFSLFKNFVFPRHPERLLQRGSRNVRRIANQMGQNGTVVLWSCSTGLDTKWHPSFARWFSAIRKDLTVFAPTSDINHDPINRFMHAISWDAKCLNPEVHFQKMPEEYSAYRAGRSIFPSDEECQKERFMLTKASLNLMRAYQEYYCALHIMFYAVQYLPTNLLIFAFILGLLCDNYCVENFSLDFTFLARVPTLLTSGSTSSKVRTNSLEAPS